MRPPAYVYERSHSVDEERQQRRQHAAREVDGHVPGRERGHRASIDVRARHDGERIGAIRRGRSDSIARDVRIGVSSTRPPDATLAVVATEPPPARAGEPRRDGRGDDEARHRRAPSTSTAHERSSSAAVPARRGRRRRPARRGSGGRGRSSRDHRAARSHWPLDRRHAAARWQSRPVRSSKAPCSARYEPGAWKTVTREGEEVVGARARHGRGRLGRRPSCRDGSRSGRTARGTSSTARRTTSRPRPLPSTRPSSPQGAGGLSAESLGPDEMRDLGMGALLGVGAGSYNEPRLIVLRWEPPSPARERRPARARRQGDDVRLRRHLAEARDPHGGHEGRHGRRGRRRRRHRRARRARGPGPRDGRRRSRREHAERAQHASRRHPHRRQRQDDRGDEHRRRGSPRARRRALVRPRAGRDARRRLRDADRGDGTSRSATSTPGVFANDDAWRDEIVAAGEASGDYVWPFPLHPRYRRLIDSAFADMKNSSLRRLGGARLRDVIPRRVRGRGAVGAHRHGRARACSHGRAATTSPRSAARAGASA